MSSPSGRTSALGRIGQRLGQSVAKRVAFGKGYPFRFRLTALTMSKARQREFYDALLPPGGAAFARAAVRKRSRARRLEDLLPTILDAEWYARVNGLAAPARSASHYMKVGRHSLLSPSATLARSQDGVTLSQAGAEQIVRAGGEVGLISEGLLAPDDPEGLRRDMLDNPNKRSMAVVTANFGGHEALLPVDPDWAALADFFVFTDRKFSPRGGWVPVHANYHHVEPAWRAAFFKTHLCMYFGSYSAVLWVDEDILICRAPEPGGDAVGDGALVFPFRKDVSNTETGSRPDARVMWVAPGSQQAKEGLRALWQAVAGLDDPDPLPGALHHFRDAPGQHFSTGERALSDSSDFAARA